MKKFFTIFFVVLGVIFFFIILAFAYLFIVDPFNIKPYIFNSNTPSTSQVEMTSDSQSDTTVKEQPTSNSTLSPAQQKALELVGIEPSSVPQSFTPEQLKCFETVLGLERVNAIKAGDTPSATEFFKAKSCI